MKEFIRTNYQFICLCFIWIAFGALTGSILAIAVIILSVIALKQKGMYQEIFLGFLVVLILSDSRHHWLEFAGDVKIFYILLMSAFLFFDKKNFTSLNRLFFLFTPFFLLALFLVVSGENWLVSFQKYLSYLLLLIIIPNYLIKIYQETGVGFLKNIIFIFFTVLLIGLLLKYVNPELTTLSGRYRGIFGNPNGLGLFCTLFFLLFAVIKEYYPNLFTRGEYISIYAVIILSIIFCGSRNSIICLICFFIFQKLYKSSPFLGFIALFILAIGYELILNNLNTIIGATGMGDYFRIQTLETGSGRNIAWSFAWEQIQNNFFLGKGFAYDEILFKEYYNELSIRGHQGNVHNSYLSFWINTGIIGLFFFLRGFFLAFFKGAKNTFIAFPIMYTVLFSANFESWLAGSLNPITFQLWIILTIITSDEFNKNRAENKLAITNKPE